MYEEHRMGGPGWGICPGAEQAAGKAGFMSRRCVGMIAIAGISMPASCSQCPCMRYEFRAYDDPIGCVFTGKTHSRNMTERQKECPLVEIEEIRNDNLR